MAFYLVTGGAGFIGSHLTRALLEQGHRVRVLDNLSTGKRERVPNGVEFVFADFTKLDDIRNSFEGVDGVFHMGALARIPFSIEHPLESAQANIFGTLNVLVASRDAKVKRVVYSASSSAYGSQDVLPLHPGLTPAPISPYALQKYVGERFAEQFARFYGLETVSLRYFNVYGPSMADQGAYVSAISVFKQQRRAGLPLTIHGDGLQTRDFTHVSDVVQANVLAMSSPKVGQGEVLNVGAGANHSILKIADIFGGERVFLESRKAEVRHTLADISKTKELLGWEPRVKFEDGLQDLLRFEGLLPKDPPASV